MACGEAVVTVGSDPVGVRGEVVLGGDVLPGLWCRWVLWGHGRGRLVPGDGLVGWRVRSRRARCSRCEAAHVLLPVSCLVRHVDTVGCLR